MKLTKRQEYILDDWLGCGDMKECRLTNNLIDCIERSTTYQLRHSKELKEYYDWHKNEYAWWDEMADGTNTTLDDCYHWILEMLVDLIDYSEYEDDKYADCDNRIVYDKDKPFVEAIFNMLKQDSLEDWDTLPQMATLCIEYLQDSQASYLNGLSKEDEEYELVDKSVDTCCKIIKLIGELW